MLFEFLNILILCIVSAILAIVVVGLSYFIVKQQADPEKVSAYECGFEPFEDARNTFDIRFYLVAILFIVFDLEISFLFPWVLVLTEIGYTGLYAMFIFLLVLTIGFVYEWCKGALEWN